MMKINAKELVQASTSETRYIVAFDHLDVGSEIQRHVEEARNLRSAYYGELMRRVWDCVGRWLRKHIPPRTPSETTVGHQHRTGS